MHPAALDAPLALARRADFVFVSTLHDGFPDTRVMFNLLKLRADVLTSCPAALDQPFASWLGTNTSSQKVRHVQAEVGHYGVFNGRRWRTEIYPKVREFILAHG